MKIQGRGLALLSLAMILLLVFSSTVMAQDRKMKMSEYKARLASAQEREAATNKRIAQLEADIARLKAQIAEVQAQIDAEWAAIYALLGVTKADVEAYRKNLADIEAKLDALAGLSPEELYRKKSEVDALCRQLEEAKKSKIALLTEMEEKIAALEAKCTSLKAKMTSVFDTYTVVKGDYLWKIAKKPEIYGDPYQWIRIYSVNRDLIKDPDLIYPNWVLKIQRTLGANEHLVMKGEFLRKIAGYAQIYNDPTKWTKIYQANKDIIRDPNLIYPYQVLQIPRD